MSARWNGRPTLAGAPEVVIAGAGQGLANPNGAATDRMPDSLAADREEAQRRGARTLCHSITA